MDADRPTPPHAGLDGAGACGSLLRNNSATPDIEILGDVRDRPVIAAFAFVATMFTDPFRGR